MEQKIDGICLNLSKSKLKKRSTGILKRMGTLSDRVQHTNAYYQSMWNPQHRQFNQLSFRNHLNEALNQAAEQ
jgi:predicted metal-dependent hydrolase